MNTWDDIDHQKREAELREAYAARRLPPLDSATGADLTDADREYLREHHQLDRTDGSFFPTELQVVRLIATHAIHVSPFDAHLYARIDTREVGVKYSAVGGDKAKAVRLAVREVLRLVGVTA